MSRYFPHASYAEDQPLSKTILTTHVLTRGVTTGSIIGLSVFSVRSAIQRFRSTTPSSLSATTTTPTTTWQHRLLRTTGRSTLITTALTSVALAGRMWGREDIEWGDRSWRLLENKGQLETDDWTYGGMAVGGLLGLGATTTTTMMKRLKPATVVVRIVGAAGLGSVVGTVGYLGWRYGVKGGKFDDE